ncbi:MAG: O-antigen ligase family protein, partial [Planctomycetales bacterium]|nr:O-antigen ligase family protein [Planctomycetales bacterium]
MGDMLPVAMLLIAALGLGSIMRPAWALSAGICVYAFEQWAQVNTTFFAQNSTYLNLFSGTIVLAAVLSSFIIHGRNPLRDLPPLVWMLSILYIFTGLTCIWSIDSNISWFFYKMYLPYNLSYVFLMPLILTRTKDAQQALLRLLIVGSIVSILVLSQTQIHEWGRTIKVGGGGVQSQWGQEVHRLNPLAVASMGGHVLIAALMLNFKGVARFWQIVRWGVAFVCLAVILRSGSRGQLFAIVVSVVVFIWISRSGSKTNLRMLLMGTVGLLLFFAVASLSFGYFADAGRWNLDLIGKDYSETRVEMSKKVLMYWVSSSPVHWLLGLGSSASFDHRVAGFYPHVVPVEILGELGVVGFVLFVSINVMAWRSLYRMFVLTGDSPEERGVVACMAALLLFELLLLFKQGSFLDHH